MAVETTLVIEKGITITGRPLKDHLETLDRYDAIRYVRFEFPSPSEIPALMGYFAGWLSASPATPEIAFTAHRRLVDIHPFNDGNGRTARLLMNLVLIRGGYPPIAVRPEDRLAYIRALQQSQAGQGTESFDTLLYERLDATLGEYISVFETAQLPGTSQG